MRVENEEKLVCTIAAAIQKMNYGTLQKLSAFIAGLESQRDGSERRRHFN